MVDRSGMSIPVDSPSDETLNLSPLVLRRQYEFPFRIIIVQFLIFFFIFYALVFSFRYDQRLLTSNFTFFPKSKSLNISRAVLKLLI